MKHLKHSLALAPALLLGSAVTLLGQEAPEGAATPAGTPAETPAAAEAAAPAAEEAPAPGTFDDAAASMQQQLEDAVAELTALRQQLADEKIPLSRELSRLEGELTAARSEFARATGQLNKRKLDTSTLKADIKRGQDDVAYLETLLSDYINEFQSRLHITELQLYQEQLDAAKLAPQNDNLSDEQVLDIQAAMFMESLDRLEDALGGRSFEAKAVDPNGLVRKGTVVLVGPTALFRADDGSVVGTAEQRLGSLEPTIIPFANNPELTATADDMVASSDGLFVMDPTLGDAHKIEATEDTLLDEFEKGGEVMWPIVIMAGLALLVAIIKWLSLLFTRKPSQKRIDALIDAVKSHDEEAIGTAADNLKGPVGRMIKVGVEHIREPRELIEEVMYETVLTTRLKVERMLPFIAICAASAPLLGLLGTVTGIINTFKLITVFGSGDVKSLSGGISEALITTKFGLVVAIPSLLLHAYLSRKARGVVGQMEQTAVAFVNQVSKTPFQDEHRDAGGRPTPPAPAAPPEDAPEVPDEALVEV